MLEIGDVVEGYRIDAVLGRGGMGAVYEATQLSLNRTVALKVITAELSREPAFRERFRREGLLQASLEHPHIVTVYEAGESEHGLFLAMRLIRGPNLKDLILARQLDVGRTLRILSQAADALDAAHEAGLIHRDIKPHNILVAAGRDHAYLADFGVTKAPGDRSLTRTGALVGTLDYISPEQIRGHRATSASDVYAFSCVLFECLTGVVPFPKDSDAAVLYAHVAEPPPRVCTYRPELPMGVDDVLARGMAKTPDERPGCAAHLLLELEQALGDRLKPTIAAPAPLQYPEQAGIRRAAELTETPALNAPATRLAPGTPLPAPAEQPSEPPAPVVPTTPTPAPAPAEQPSEPPPPVAPTTPAPAPAQQASEAPVAPAGAGAAATPQPEYGVHWLGDRYTPAGELSVPTRAAETPLPQLPPHVETRRRRLPPLVAAGAAAALAAVVAGFLIGNSTADAETAAPAGSRAVSNGPLRFDVPSGWQRLEQIPTVLRTRLRNPLAFAPSDQLGSGGLVAGLAGASAPDFVPASTRAALPARALDARDRVRVQDAEAFRYAQLVPSGFNGTMTLLSVPRTEDVALVGCFVHTGAPRSILRRCEEIAATFDVDGAGTFPLTPGSKYAATLNATLRALGSSRQSALTRLRTAKKPGAQAAAADAAARAYAAAATRLRREQVTPLTQPPTTRLVTALTQTDAAYRALARAARAGDKASYDAARRTVTRRQARLDAAVADLRDLGFVFG